MNAVQDGLTARIMQEGRSALLMQAVVNLLIRKDLIDAGRLDAVRREIDTRQPMLGARLAARAWTDDRFRDLLLTDAKQAVFDELGIRISQGPEFVVVENTPDRHHVIVCTLCSCYPKAVLGLPPEWYKSFAYRSRMVIEPRAILRKFGTELPENTEIRVMDSTADMRYMVLPLRPPGTSHLTTDELAALVSRDDLIGVTVPGAP
ncbi:nitrile hydratase subunit alpha [Thalassospiraceae bacterium LMO-SO8]|nr:nitrile hydratase subunit alpha [Alphaproteobacteria bacterium LMO-S08]WND76727.1 nitrile hydratase subunit alpha [Thalassospiraceae bacterium LMO-SO8]